jgi:hypothetical protein
MGGKSSKKRMPELAITGQSGADTADKKSERKDLNHLQNT